MARLNRYALELRFTLVNTEQRLYTVERCCDNDSITDWIWIGGPDSLEPLAKELLRHLGRDSFDELF